jgi:hypothetical protein
VFPTRVIGAVGGSIEPSGFIYIVPTRLMAVLILNVRINVLMRRSVNIMHVTYLFFTFIFSFPCSALIINYDAF